jgi:pyrimidine deaminase RibD-like protein
MANTDLDLMNKAIELAERCTPISDHVPRVGAVIAVNGVIIGSGHRDPGTPEHDDHAEKKALAGVSERGQLPDATVYTTLEPCTPGVRSDPLNCCTNLLKEAGVKKVFVGILDPNQGVTGKGLWELQDHGIEVELFPPKLANRIRTINSSFIRLQRSLGLTITNTVNGQIIRTYDRAGIYNLAGTFVNPPGEDVIAFTSIGGRWWPQPYQLSVDEREQKWSVKLHFGTYNDHTLSIVRANDLGVALIKYYRKITSEKHALRRAVEETVADEDQRKVLLDLIGAPYPPIEMSRLPKGLQLLAQVDVKIEEPPKQ